MSGVPVVRAFQTDNSQDGVAVILQLLDHAEALADEQGLTELSFLIGLASVAASDIVEGSASGLDL